MSRFSSFTFVLSLLVFGACKSPAPVENQESDHDSIAIETENTGPSKVKSKVLQDLIDSSQVLGSVLLFDPETNTYYSNNFDRCDKGYLPASTFKITNSIIALETEVMTDDSTLIKWDGEKRRMKIWEQDLVFRDAFHVSCVPCYQDIARKIGPERMNQYLTDFNYGNMVVDSSNIDVFWLEGSSKITQNEQLDFIQRFYGQKLPIKKRTHEIMKRLMVINEKSESRFSGKSGWSIREGNNVGWFVGYLEKDDKVFYVATNIEPKPSLKDGDFSRIRIQLSEIALNQLVKDKL